MDTVYPVALFYRKPNAHQPLSLSLSLTHTHTHTQFVQLLNHSGIGAVPGTAC